MKLFYLGLRQSSLLLGETLRFVCATQASSCVHFMPWSLVCFFKVPKVSHPPWHLSWQLTEPCNFSRYLGVVEQISNFGWYQLVGHSLAVTRWWWHRPLGNYGLQLSALSPWPHCLCFVEWGLFLFSQSQLRAVPFCFRFLANHCPPCSLLKLWPSCLFLTKTQRVPSRLLLRSLTQSLGQNRNNGCRTHVVSAVLFLCWCFVSVSERVCFFFF